MKFSCVGGWYPWVSIRGLTYLKLGMTVAIAERLMDWKEFLAMRGVLAVFWNAGLLHT